MKKSIAVIAIMISLIMSMAACGNTSNNNSAPTTSADGTAAAGESTGGGSVFNSQGYPIVNQPVTLKIATSKDPRGLEPNEMLFNKKIAEKTGVTIQWITIASESYQEKKNLMLASADLPDVFLNGIKQADILMYAPQGLFIPVEQLQEQYCTLLNQVYEKRPDYKKAMYAPDGHIYGFPRTEEMNGLIANHGILHINKTWLDELGLAVPTTLDEWKNCLIAFRDTDPNGNGKNDEIPFTYVHNGLWSKGSFLTSWRNNSDLGQFMGCFGDADKSDSLNIKDGKIYCTAVTDAYKAGINYFHQLYTEKLIDPDFASQDQAKYQAKLNAEVPILGSFICFSISDDTNAERKGMYVSVPYLKGPNGEFGCRENVSELSDVCRFVITKACKTPEIAVRWADTFYDPQTSVEANWGPLDYQYKLNDKNVMVYDDLKDGLENHSQMRYRHSLVDYPNAVLSDYYDTVVEYPQDAQYLYNDMRNVGFVDKHLNDPYIPVMWYSKEDSERMAQISPLIYGEIDKRRAIWVIDGGVEKDWNTYLDTLKKNGLDEFIGIIQKTYDDFKTK